MRKNLKKEKATQTKDNLVEQIKKLPKGEIHVHLEGTITPELFMKIAKRNNMSFDHSPYIFNDFQGFLKNFKMMTSILRKPEDYYDIAIDFLTRQAKLGVVYTEFFVSITNRMYSESRVNEVLTAIKKAIDETERKYKTKSNVIIDVNRASTWDPEGKIALSFALKNRKNSVVGLGLGGDENFGSFRDYRGVFEKAKRAGLGVCAHAGEMGPARNVNKAIKILNVNRIGHGTHSAENNKTLKTLRKNKTTLVICPSSEFQTKSFFNFESYPFCKLVKNNINITVASDDPALFNTNIIEEYKFLIEKYSLSKKQLFSFIKQSFEASFLQNKNKDYFLDKINRFS